MSEKDTFEIKRVRGWHLDRVYYSNEEIALEILEEGIGLIEEIVSCIQVHKSVELLLFSQYDFIDALSYIRSELADNNFISDKELYNFCESATDFLRRVEGEYSIDWNAIDVIFLESSSEITKQLEKELTN